MEARFIRRGRARLTRARARPRHALGRQCSTPAIVRAASGSFLVFAVVGCASGSHARASFESGVIPTSAPASPSASQLPTCGPAPVSDGPLAGKVVATIEGPSSAASGSMLHVDVEVRPTVSGSVFVSTGSPAIVFILRGTTVVGQTLGPIAGVGLESNVTAASPMSVDAFIALSGCGRVASTDSAVSPLYGPPLTPGAYSLIAVVEDATDGEGSGKVFVSEPFPLTVTPADTAVTSDAPGSSQPS